MGKRIVILILLLAGVSQALAQSPVTEAEAKKRKEENTRKALIIAGEAIESAQSLKLPENRIRLLVAAADLLWQHDEKRARGLFKNATEALSEIQAAELEKDTRHNQGGINSIQLRHEMLSVVVKYDPALAMQFIRATRQPSREAAGNYNQPDPELNLEFKLAQHIAGKDPEEGLRIAQEALAKGIDHDVIGLIYQLQSQKKELASNLCSSIIKRLRSEDISKNQIAASVALNLLRMAAEPPATSPNTSVVIDGGQGAYGQMRGLLQARDMAELAGIAARYYQQVIAGQAAGYSGVDMTNMIRPVLHEIEKYAPSQAQALKQGMAEYDKANQLTRHPSVRIYEKMQNSTTEGLLELAKEAPPDLQTNIYQNAAWRLFSENKIEQGLQIINDKISNPALRAEMLEQFERQRLMQASSSGKVDEAFEQALRIRSVEERIEVLISIANNAMAAGDKKKGLQVLAEARALLAARAENYAQMASQFQMARAFLPHDHQACFSIIEPIMEQLNRLMAASVVLSGFDMPEYFKGGEMVLHMGGSLANYIQDYSQILGELARKNFDRAKSLADTFQPPEVRALAYISIAQSLLKEEEEPSPGDGQVGARD